MDPVESWARVFKFTKELRGGTNLSLFYSWKTWNCDCPKQKEMNIGKSFEIFTTSRSSRPEVKKLFLKMSQNWPENTSVRFTFLIKLQSSPLEKETQVFSREFCEIFRNPFFKVHLRWLPLNIHVDMMFFWWINSINCSTFNKCAQIRSVLGTGCLWLKLETGWESLSLWIPRIFWSKYGAKLKLTPTSPLDNWLDSSCC